MKTLKIALLIGIASFFASQHAGAVVIDFDDAATGGCQVTSGASIDGFTLSAGTGGINNSAACSFLNASGALSGDNYMVNFNSRVATFTRDVGTFTLNSLWVHADSRVGGTTVRFQGLDGIGGNVLNTIDIVIGASWQQIVFSGWDNITTFTWDSAVPDISNISIDDFEYDAEMVAVPAPASLALLGLGLLALGRRRIRSA